MAEPTESDSDAATVGVADWVAAWTDLDLTQARRLKLVEEMSGASAADAIAVAAEVLGRRPRGKARALAELDEWARTQLRIRAAGDRVRAAVSTSGSDDSD